MVKDNVKCTNYGFNGLIDKGAEDCPDCAMVGSLAWKDNEEQEVEI